MNKKVFYPLFTAGVLCVFAASFALYYKLQKSDFQESLYYKIGSVQLVQGEPKKKVEGKNFISIAKEAPVYSNEIYLLEENDFLSLKLAEEEIRIFGPAEFSFNLVDPQEKQIFINFTKLNQLEPKEASYKVLHPTYKGWSIENFFRVEDLVSKNKRSFANQGLEAGLKEKPKEFNERDSYLEEVIGTLRPLLKKCYENYLKENPMSKGSLMVHFSLQNTGRVSATKVKDSTFFNDSEIKRCIKNVFKNIETKAFAGDSIEVQYPIEFE